MQIEYGKQTPAEQCQRYVVKNKDHRLQGEEVSDGSLDRATELNTFFSS